MLKGADYPVIAGEVWALVAFAIAFAALALFRFRRTLD
jgi:ABC-2 type transport system permease protein